MQSLSKWLLITIFDIYLKVPEGDEEAKITSTECYGKSCPSRQLQPVWILLIIRCLISSPSIYPVWPLTFLLIPGTWRNFSMWGMALLLPPISKTVGDNAELAALPFAFGTNFSLLSIRASIWQHSQNIKCICLVLYVNLQRLIASGLGKTKKHLHFHIIIEQSVGIPSLNHCFGSYVMYVGCFMNLTPEESITA